MMRIKNTASALVLLATGLLAGCGGGSGGSIGGGGGSTLGHFLDAAVGGLTYNCTLNGQAVTGVTAADGAFNCTPGSTVTFSVGKITLGSTTSASVITPINLAGAGSSSASPAVQAIVQLLLSLDPAAATAAKAGTPVNSITISPAVLTAANNLAPITIGATTNQAAIDAWLTTLGAATTVNYLPSVTPAQATTHLNSTMSGLFQGSYSGSFTGAFAGTWSVTIDALGNVTGTATDALGGVGIVTGAVTPTLGAGNGFSFTGTGGGTPWAGTLDISTGKFNGTWGGIATNTYTGTKAAVAGAGAGAGTCPAGQIMGPAMVCVPAGVTGGGVAAGTLMGGAKQGTALNLTTAVTSLAGSGILGALDGTGLAATFNNPSQITTDGTNLYVADLGNNKIRQIVIASGAVTTLAGSGTCGNVDGTGIAALFCWPSGITTDGTNLYVVDKTNSKIRQIVIATGVVTTLAGSGQLGAVDGTGIAATFNNPDSITTDGANLYVTDLTNNKIRKIVIATGVVTTLAGSGAAGALDGTGIAASFSQPHGITTDGANLYVADTINNSIRKIVIATGAVTTLVNGGVTGINLTTLVATVALFTTPSGITTDGTNLYITDINKVHKIVIATGAVTTLAGGGGNPPLGQPINGTGAAATFLGSAGITTDGISLYVADTLNRIIRKIQ